VGVDRSLSFPAKVQVFLTTQSEPGCRVAPNSLSNTRSYPLSTPIPKYDCFTKLNIIWDSLFICCELPCQSKFASKSVYTRQEINSFALGFGSELYRTNQLGLFVLVRRLKQ